MPLNFNKALFFKRLEPNLQEIIIPIFKEIKLLRVNSSPLKILNLAFNGSFFNKLVEEFFFHFLKDSNQKNLL